MTHDHAPAPPTAEMFTAEYWDDRYAATDRHWSGNPNAQLVAQVAELAPGRALDVGCGEGADAVWLAEQGWAVTAVDVSQVALERGARHAAERAVGERITWRQIDAFEWAPPAATFDLVSAQFMYLPTREDVDALFVRLADGVRPGGRLLVVGHHPTDAATGLRSPHLAEMGFTGDDVASLLAPADWEIVFVGAPQRSQRGPDGVAIAVTDAVLHARRR